MRVRDNGKGVDPQHLSDEGRGGHFGVRGMRERSKLIGGKLTLWSERDSDTEAELSILGAHVYAQRPSATDPGSLKKLTGKFSRKDTELKS